LEGVLAARYSTNFYRNDLAVYYLKRLIGESFQSVVFEPDAEEDVTMTWNLSHAELDQLRQDLATATLRQWPISGGFGWVRLSGWVPAWTPATA
jgi:hypothetical protein